MGYFLQSGDSFSPAPSKESLLECLPTGNYTVEESVNGMFFQRAEKFKPLTKLYGSHEKWSTRILNTFKERAGNTGVLFAGEKGSGKSLLARVISRDAALMGMSTIVINKPWTGDRLGSILAQLTSPAVIFMDEFEKVYNDSQTQETVLTLLDGTASTKHLFILTVNDSHRLDSHLKNRPGRLYYSIDFHGLENDFILDYCKDTLDQLEHTDAIVRLASLFEEFNFDMLKALIEEMNRYQESPAEAVKLLNITPADSKNYYDVEIIDPAGKLRKTDEEWYGSPLFLTTWEVSVFPEDPSLEEDDDAYTDIEITGDELASFNAEKNEYIFKHGDWRIILTSRQKKNTNLTHWATY